MESDKKGGSMFGTVLVMIILVGMVIYYLSNKNQIPQTTPENTVENSQTINEQSNQAMNQAEVEIDLETEINNLDTNFDDMNAEDLGI